MKPKRGKQADLSTIHKKALSQGIKVENSSELDDDTTLIKYLGISTCFLYQRKKHGVVCNRVYQLGFRDIEKTWKNQPDFEFDADIETEICRAKHKRKTN